MKLRLRFRFLVLSVFTAGVLSFFPAAAEASCTGDYSSCRVTCSVEYLYDQNYHPAEAMANWQRCEARCLSGEMSCISANAWQEWLYQVDLNIGDNFRILDEPNPACAYYPDELFNCGNLETAEEIESCTMMIQQEQARDHCP